MPIKRYLGKPSGSWIDPPPWYPKGVEDFAPHLIQTEHELRKQKPAKHVMCQIYYTTAICLDMNKLGRGQTITTFFTLKSCMLYCEKSSSFDWGF